MTSSRGNRNVMPAIIGLSVVIYGVIALLAYVPPYEGLAGVDLTFLPMVNAILNTFTTIFLATAWVAIRKKQIAKHRRFIFAAFGSTALFLVTYIIYHSLTASTPYGGTGLLRPIYFFVLLTHIVLAAAIVPFALASAAYGLDMQVPRHRRIARWTMPAWLYVSVTGVLVYLMIRPYY